ncbi:MAG: hypothetical protein JXA61_05510 [Bacteroidales bacterium]|nr:hypothetical protein [Bacteroidales bacterium]
MLRYLTILLLILYPELISNEGFSYYDRGRPTSKGIERFVLVNEHQLAKDYMDFVEDTLYYYHMWVDDLSEYMEYDSIELGRYYFPGDIIITNEQKYVDYAVDSLSSFRRSLTVSNQFVKGCVYHELTHIWFQQILREMDYSVSPEHNNFRIYTPRDRDYGAGFIEEGICEYVAHKAGEIIYPKKVVPNIDNNWDTYEINYQYAEYFVRQILDRYENIKEGIKMILRTPPPTKEEILNPELYYQRVFI